MRVVWNTANKQSFSFDCMRVFVHCFRFCFAHFVYTRTHTPTVCYGKWIHECADTSSVHSSSSSSSSGTLAFVLLHCDVRLCACDWMEFHLVCSSLFSLQIGLSLTLCGCHVFFVVNKVNREGKTGPFQNKSVFIIINLFSFFIHNRKSKFHLKLSVKTSNNNQNRSNFQCTLWVTNCKLNYVSRKEHSKGEKRYGPHQFRNHNTKRIKKKQNQ